MSRELQLRARLLLGDEIAFGPGKAELLAAIERTGSIAAAAREMQMSYRRAWLLVDAMNRCFREPLVSSATGGTQGGGASLTASGREVLQIYSALLADLEQAAAPHRAALERRLRKQPAP